MTDNRGVSRIVPGHSNWKEFSRVGSSRSARIRAAGSIEAFEERRLCASVGTHDRIPIKKIVSSAADAFGLSRPSAIIAAPQRVLQAEEVEADDHVRPDPIRRSL